MSRREKNPAADQLLHISNTPVCVCFVCERANQRDELVMTGLSGKIFSNALEELASIWTCLSGILCLHRRVRKPDILSDFLLEFPSGWKVVHVYICSCMLLFLCAFCSQQSSTCAAVVTSSPHQGGLTHGGQISRWRWADGEGGWGGTGREDEQFGTVKPSQRHPEPSHNHREFSEWVSEQL